jgi:hypothetical protein
MWRAGFVSLQCVRFFGNIHNSALFVWCILRNKGIGYPVKDVCMYTCTWSIFTYCIAVASHARRVGSCWIRPIFFWMKWVSVWVGKICISLIVKRIVLLLWPPLNLIWRSSWIDFYVLYQLLLTFSWTTCDQNNERHFFLPRRAPLVHIHFCIANMHRVTMQIYVVLNQLSYFGAWVSVRILVSSKVHYLVFLKYLCIGDSVFNFIPRLRPSYPYCEKPTYLSGWPVGRIFAIGWLITLGIFLRLQK